MIKLYIGLREVRERSLLPFWSEVRRQGKLSFDISYDRHQLVDYLCLERATCVEKSKVRRTTKITKGGIIQDKGRS